MVKTLSLFQEEKVQLVDVAIPYPVEDPFTYELPTELQADLQAGCRVRIPFKNRIITGYAVGLESRRPVNHAKKVLEILDEQPVLTDHQLRLAKWISQYYFSSWGEAISNLVPSYIKKKNQIQRSKSASLDPPSTFAKHVKVTQLNEEQTQALKRIKALIDQDQFAEAFLFGVTGGGKSELYIRAIEEVLARGKSAICLVPEIALTEQLKYFFIQHFHAELEILHSKLTDRQRYDAWEKIKRGEKRVILGARSAVFAPALNLGLIIMDEEQEGSYKQDQTPRYHAREAARWRAQDLKIPFLMGTATPSLESMHRISLGEIERLTLSKRVDGRSMPEVKIIDLKQAQDAVKKTVIISTALQAAMERALKTKGGILIMLNRRGFSTHIRCASCHLTFYCPHCAVALTFHQNEQELLCHYCNYRLPIPHACPKCSHALLKFSGVGTEKVESEIAMLFPAARVARLDTDTSKKRGAHERILGQFRAQEIDILVGTQMIAKGFDFQHVTLVGIVNADTGLLLPDFRSSERTFQLLIQMAGRTGRGKEPGLVFVQTHSPHHYSIRYASKHDYLGFFQEEIGNRREFRYPPFTKIINLAFRGKIEHEVHTQACEFQKHLNAEGQGDGIDVIGPAPLPLYRLRGHFRWHVMIRGTSIESLGASVRKALKNWKRKKGVFLAIDVDPISIL